MQRSSAPLEPNRRISSRRPGQLAAFTAFNLVLAFFPLTTLLASNPHILRQPVTRELQLLTGGFLAVFLLNELVFLRFRNWRIHALFYFGLLLFFSWKLILDTTDIRGLAGAVLYFALVAALLGAAVWASRSREFTTILTTMLLVFAVGPAIRVVLTGLWGGEPAPPAGRAGVGRITQASESHRPGAPNVYLLIFDTMVSTGKFLEHVDGSPDSRRHIREFEEAMQALGYQHFPQAWSNYGRTSSSMLSFFNFDYLRSDFQWKMKYYGLTASAMLDYFKGAGYRIVSSKKDVPCPEVFDHCYPTVNQLEVVSMLASMTPTIYLSQRLDKYLFTPLGSGALRRVAAGLTSTKLAEIDHFVEYLDNKPVAEAPELTYAHFFAAHPGNFYDANCETESIDLFEQRSGEDLTAAFSFSRYGAEYFCFLGKIVEVARAIERRDPQAWVFITSDHGFGIQSYGTESEAPWDRVRLDATFSVLSAVKTPAACREDLAALKSSVNKVRGMINCLEGAVVLPYLPDEVDLRYIGPDVRLTIGEYGYRAGAMSRNRRP